MADRVYPTVIVFLKTAWKYLGLKFTFTGDVNIPRNGGAILAITIQTNKFLISSPQSATIT
jgi:hypothetical protein